MARATAFRALFRVRLDIFRTFQFLFIKMFHTVLSFSQKIRYTLWVQYIGFFRPMQDTLHRVLLKTKEQILHITNVLYLLLGSSNVLSLADVPPKQLISLPDILRQTFQSLVPQFLRHPVKSFGNAAGDAGKGVAVAAQRDRIAKYIPLYQVSPLKSERIIVLMYFLGHQFPTPL